MNNENNKGYIMKCKNNPIGKFVKDNVSADLLRLNNAELIPHDEYVGPFITAKSAGFRHPDGTVDKMPSNNPEMVKKYTELMQSIMGIDFKPGVNDIIATYFVSPEELETAVSDLKILYESKSEINFMNGPGEILSQCQLNELDYRSIAKLIPFKDKYDEAKLMMYGEPKVYNDDYSKEITDKSIIDKVKNEYESIRKQYSGQKPLQEVRESIVNAAFNTKRELPLIQSDGSNYLNEGLAI